MVTETSIINIDRLTIRKNPYAGRTEISVPGVAHKSILIRFICSPGKTQEKLVFYCQMLKAAGCAIIVQDCEVSQVRIEAVLSKGIDATDLYLRIKNNLDTDSSLTSQTVNTKYEREVSCTRLLAPEPTFLFSWIDTIVECSACREKFLHTELESDYEFYGDDEIWSDCICPKCGFWNCCELEFESMTSEEMERVLFTVEKEESNDD